MARWPLDAKETRLLDALTRRVARMIVAGERGITLRGPEDHLCRLMPEGLRICSEGSFRKETDAEYEERLYQAAMKETAGS